MVKLLYMYMHVQVCVHTLYTCYPHRNLHRAHTIYLGIEVDNLVNAHSSVQHIQ